MTAHKLKLPFTDVIRAFIGENYVKIIGKQRSASSSSIH